MNKTLLGKIYSRYKKVEQLEFTKKWPLWSNSQQKDRQESFEFSKYIQRVHGVNVNICLPIILPRHFSAFTRWIYRATGMPGCAVCCRFGGACDTRNLAPATGFKAGALRPEWRKFARNCGSYLSSTARS